MENDDSRFVEQRHQMVEQQMRARGIVNQEVLAAMERVPRHRFVPHVLEVDAYGDFPLPIGYGQTISQPYIVALMTELARPHAGARALDVGTGSGYQAAILAELCQQVYGIEIVEPLAEHAKILLKKLGYANIEVKAGDGYQGWPEHAPFDLIIVAAAAPRIPQPLVDQLAPHGRLVIPVGEHWQELLVLEKDPDGRTHQKAIAPVAFVPMVGAAQER